MRCFLSTQLPLASPSRCFLRLRYGPGLSTACPPDHGRAQTRPASVQASTRARSASRSTRTRCTCSPRAAGPRGRDLPRNVHPHPRRRVVRLGLPPRDRDAPRQARRHHPRHDASLPDNPRRCETPHPRVPPDRYRRLLDQAVLLRLDGLFGAQTLMCRTDSEASAARSTYLHARPRSDYSTAYMALLHRYGHTMLWTASMGILPGLLAFKGRQTALGSVGSSGPI